MGVWQWDPLEIFFSQKSQLFESHHGSHHGRDFDNLAPPLHTTTHAHFRVQTLPCKHKRDLVFGSSLP